MNLTLAAAALAAYIEADIPVMMWSPPGCGKSDTGQGYAADRSMKLIDFRASTRDTVALMGLPDLSGDTTTWKVPDEFPQVKRDGEEGILFLEEINTAAPSMQAALFGLVLDRKVGNYTLPPGWRIIAAGNRQSDRASAQRMPSALANRFAHIDIEPDVDTWTRWANKSNLDPMVVAFVRWRPELLHKMEGSELRAFPTPRSWAQVAKVVNAPPSLRFGLIAGLVGEGAATEIEGFIRIYRNLPSLDLVLANPNSAPLVEDPAARFAMASGLARKANEQNFANAMAYIQRIPAREFHIMFTVDAVRRDPGLSHTQTFTDWAVDNQDVTIG